MVKRFRRSVARRHVLDEIPQDAPTGEGTAGSCYVFDETVAVPRSKNCGGDAAGARIKESDAGTIGCDQRRRGGYNTEATGSPCHAHSLRTRDGPHHAELESEDISIAP